VAIEISYATIIRNNTVTNNGWADPRNRYTYLWNAGIGIHASQNVEIYGNTVAGNYAGIVAIEQNRSTDKAVYGAHIVQNLYVHDNTITQSNLPRNGNELSVGAGIATDIAGNSGDLHRAATTASSTTDTRSAQTHVRSPGTSERAPRLSGGATARDTGGVFIRN
jgi:hypothetical protein